MKQPAVYILASHYQGTLYIGVTSDLIQRVWQHREYVADGFTQRYNVDRLVWYEQHDIMEKRHPSRETDQEMESGMENPPDRNHKSRLDRLVAEHHGSGS